MLPDDERPKRSAKGASEDLARKLQFGPYGWVVEADIRGFFDAIDHDWLIRMLEQSASVIVKFCG